ncbi:class I SAM-dependent methyltransferase [Candidatus Magnetomonas plexicatena]|uniref:class I SAM-dependent methyltransferase n=1 Tax=Candidatus Magnetomonas plexicatena TaxID=2552947 RepID=UPI0011053AC5|nr:class I SAM-dependent methyltransferase [Nitrospirales bacterium LBB_01]
MGVNDDRCILCGEKDLAAIQFSTGIAAVTSDCKPWPRLGDFAYCQRCGHIQKRLTTALLDDIKTIYSGYEIYFLSDGNEQLIFPGSVSKPRTQEILTRLVETINIPKQGRVLDIGCGNGAFLKTFGKAYPQWSLFGFEQSAIEAIPGVTEIYSGSVDTIEGCYDIVTMIYVLEHLFDPVGFLKKLHGIMAPGGMLFIQVPSFIKTPFDLTVADHCSHFYPDTLVSAAGASGFSVGVQSKDWIAKEIGILAKKSGNTGTTFVFKNTGGVDLAERSFSWLHKVAQHAAETSDSGAFGIFGTAIAGTWLANMIRPSVNFFVDEDPLKQGKVHMGLPIFNPDRIPFDDAVVYLAFPWFVAKPLFDRLSVSYPSIKFIQPPPG